MGEFENDIDPEAISKGYFVCPKCGQLAEKHPVEDGVVMCTQCGRLIRESMPRPKRERCKGHYRMVTRDQNGRIKSVKKWTNKKVKSE